MKLLSQMFFLFYAVLCFPQQSGYITLETEEGTARIPVFKREETLYTAVKALAEGLDIGYSVPSEDKIILSNRKNNVLVSDRNPFYVVRDNNGKTVEVFQVPTSTYLISGDIYIPLKYSIGFINDIFDKEVEYDETKNLLLSGRRINEYIPVTETLPELSDIKYDINSIEIDEKANGTLVRINSSKEIRFYNNSYDDGILTIIFRGVNSDPSIPGRIGFSGLIKKLDIKNNGEDSEISFHLSGDYSASELLKIDGGNDILITLHNKVFAGKEPNRLKEKWDFDVIVLDAGHGGKDAGAIAVNGAKEKDINLAITLRLGKMIEEKLPGVKVEYTRKDDSFVELYKRGRIANERNGKLFISIHCNSTPNKKSKASGFEVYLLRPGRTQEAIGIAERENSVIKYEEDPKRYQQLTDENFILVSMAHSAYMKYSEKFSEYLDKHFSKGFGLPNRGVKQAGFYVLVGASMPGVLIETGFLSNKTDADYLTSKKGQEKTAELIFQSIKSFKGYYESFLGFEN
jgi:N-acetylmuramoyl-L-alanine amidase